MFFETRVINGVLCWRNSPNVGFTPYTAEELTKRLSRLLGEIEAVAKAYKGE